MTTALTANEVLIDLFMERAIDLLRLEAGTRNKVIEFLKELEAELVINLARIDPTAGRQQERLKKLLEEVRATLRGSYRDISTLMAREIREIMDDEAAWTARALNTATRATFVDVGLSRELLRTLVSDLLIQGAASKDWWSRQAGGVAERFADEMRRGMALGENNSDLIARTRSLMDVTRNSAERLVRASVQAAANSAREEMYSQNDDLIASLMWHSTLDTRTSKWCMVRDGHHYSNDENHKPKDGGPPWLEGPGKLHWGALAEGTLIETARGQIPIENVRVGDSVLTHTGIWSTVSARRAKHLKNGIVRIIYTKSGRVLRATDDHPVRLANGKWVFVGALEIGDNLLCYPESVSEIVNARSVINAETQNCPASIDQTQIAIQRACKLVAPDINFESDAERGYRKIENRCLKMILSDPAIIERDQSIAHHLFAMGDALQKTGRNRLGDILARFVGNNTSDHSQTHLFTEPFSFLGAECFGNGIGTFTRVVFDHAFRMMCILGMGFFSQPPCPVRFAGRRDNATGDMIETGLFGFVTNDDVMPLCVTRKSTVGKVVRTFNAAKGESVRNMLAGDEIGKTVFGHEQIIALEMSTVNMNVFDLEVDDHASYIANGIVVSNCRSTSVPVLKSWRDLGIDEDEIPETTRSSMDGQVPAQQNFEAWLKKQSVERQNTLLGVTVADLWRKNKITFRDLLDQSGRPLTTEELRAKAAR